MSHFGYEKLLHRGTQKLQFNLPFNTGEEACALRWNARQRSKVWSRCAWEDTHNEQREFEIFQALYIFVVAIYFNFGLRNLI